MSEWDSRDPEAPTVRYDLADWSLEDRVDLVEILADAEIRHDWDGNELLVPAECEAVVDAVIEELEEDDESPAALSGELEEFEVDGWTTADRVEFAAILVERGIRHRWEDDVLVVPTEQADIVDDLLDEFDQ